MTHHPSNRWVGENFSVCVHKTSQNFSEKEIFAKRHTNFNKKRPLITDTEENKKKPMQSVFAIDNVINNDNNVVILITLEIQ